MALEMIQATTHKEKGKKKTKTNKNQNSQKLDPCI
jgi:hypothetical protein